MRWEDERESSNVEDRRGAGGSGGFPIGGGSIGLGTIAIALVAGWIFGINPLALLGILSGEGGPGLEQSTPQGGPPPANDREARFVSVVLGSTEDVWGQIFARSGTQYPPPTLVLYSGRTPTGGCGLGQAAAGPFYCPEDRKVYLDLAFFRLLAQRFNAPGDFAQAYVIAHEIGHHVQNLTGTMNRMARARQQMSEPQYNALSVRLELQADCYAGVWARHSQQAKQWLDQSDVEEALAAASAVGDDTLQRATQGTVVPEAFTHGSAAQRVRWFREGLQSGRIEQCDTFSASRP